MGLELEGIQGVIYNGGNIVKHSIDMGMPIVFASINYRLAATGFTQSKEFDEAGLTSLGFEDQRIGMRWVKKYIAQFGGDSEKITFFGESAGAMSLAAHLVANDGDHEGLFRAAVAASGGPLKVDGPERQQGRYEALLDYVGCHRATGAEQIECLRHNATTDKIYKYTNSQPQFFGYHSVNVAFNLRGGAGSALLKDSPDRLAATGNIAQVPIIYGDMRDEGTLFCLVNNLNTTSTEEVVDYLQTIFFPNAPRDILEQLVALYPDEAAAGSPFGTGALNAITPQYKRIAALLGDYEFQSQRRQLQPYLRGPVYNYLQETKLPTANVGALIQGLAPALGSNLTSVPVLGSFHVSDVLLYYFGLIPPSLDANSLHLMSMLVGFVNAMDPNTGLKGLGVPEWPVFDEVERKTYHFNVGEVDVVRDDYRVEAMEFINRHADVLRN